MSRYRQNYTPERVNERREAAMGVLLAVTIALAGATLLFFELSK